MRATCFVTSRPRHAPQTAEHLAAIKQRHIAFWLGPKINCGSSQRYETIACASPFVASSHTVAHATYPGSSPRLVHQRALLLRPYTPPCSQHAAVFATARLRIAAGATALVLLSGGGMATSAPNTPLKDPALGPSFTDAEGDESWAKHASHSEVISTNSRAHVSPTPATSALLTLLGAGRSQHQTRQRARPAGGPA